MTTSKTASRNSKMYNALVAHCSKQYKNVGEINKAYLVGGQVYAVDYTSTTGTFHIASNTAIAETIITFK